MSSLPTDIWQVIVGFCPRKLMFREVCKQLSELEYDILYMYLPKHRPIINFPTNFRVEKLYPSILTKNLQQTGINFEHVRFIECGLNTCLEDKDLLLLPNLTTLYCGRNTNFTNAGLIGLKKLTLLDCGYNTNFTDESLVHLLNLESLECNRNTNFTNEGIAGLKKLKRLMCGHNTKLTDALLIELPNLTYIHCQCNLNFTNQGLHHLPLLENVISRKDGHITKEYVKRHLPLVHCRIVNEYGFADDEFVLL